MSQHLLKNSTHTHTHTHKDPGFQEVEVHQGLTNLRKKVWHDIEAKHIFSWPKSI